MAGMQRIVQQRLKNWPIFREGWFSEFLRVRFREVSLEILLKI
jgi:hypothetical protein